MNRGVLGQAFWEGERGRDGGRFMKVRKGGNGAPTFGVEGALAGVSMEER